ncbi:Putative tartrate transporter [Anatilimnocola aggregata]|uniref:Tartrate transporter n=1 Tax=Anatilimnocola aggregata TaxID=2528021 RepID=A0A517Y451_9BACT|nr:MFS transporter [Anatilimnocola aggregata]QDU24997.1 Putative tartrate transporter [Anatilimnocola aggregata]
MNQDLEQSTLRRVAWRIVPFICLLYVLNILDRANVGFARLAMQDDLGLTKAMFDLGYGMFYVGYILFEVPSNLLMRRFGARKWIARIMITWGLVSAATMFAQDVWTFYGLRILLGVAEAGFFPGIILYLSDWFPDRQRARMTAFFMLAIGLSNVLGNPLSGWIMDHFDGMSGLHGWQWLFLLEGLPTAVVGIAVLFYLDDSPRSARWLSDTQRDWLMKHMAEEDRVRRQQHGPDKWHAMLQPRVWLLIAIYFTVAVGSNAGGAYFPTIIKEQYTQTSNFQIGLLTALPHLCAIVAMSLVGISSDRTGERRWHLAGSALMAAIGWSLVAWGPTPLIALAGLCVAQAGMMSMLPVFWTIPSTFLSGTAAAGGIALINSVANIGGFFGATILGQLGLWSMAGILLAGGLMTAATIRNPMRVRVPIQGEAFNER